MKFSIKPANVWLIGSIVLTAAGSACAEKNPYYVGGSLGVTHISNIYRQSVAQNSDNVTTIGLLAGIDQSFGRQRVHVDASLQNNRYSTNSVLDNHSYSVSGGVDWSTVERLSGSINGSTSNALASYNVGGGVVPVFKKVEQKSNYLQTLFRLGVVTRYSLEASLTHNDQKFSEPEYQILDYDQNAASLGLYYQPHDKLRIGLAGRFTKGSYPRYRYVPFSGSPPVSIDDPFKRRDLDLTTSWGISGASQIDARISLTRLRRDIVTSQDFSGVTGSLGWNWRPTAHFSIYSRVWRDNGQDGATPSQTLNRVATSAGLSATYQATGKISVFAGANVRRSSYSSDITTAHGYDNDRGFNLGATWAYSRSISMSCQINSAGRNSSVAQYTYDTRSYGCSAQAMIY